jgi:hypothetical protein
VAISEHAANSKGLAQADTEWSLTGNTTSVATDTTDGVYQVFLDLNPLVDGDVLRFRAYEKVQSTDTQREFFRQDIANAQGATDNWVSPSFILMHGWDFTIEMVTATTRTITWSVRKIA